MSRQTIAVDIDDVLAAEAEYVIKYSNQHWGHNLKLDDYHEHWSQMWGVDHDEAERRASVLHRSGAVSRYRLLDEAKQVLHELAGRYRLVILTSRRAIIEVETIEWLEANFGGIFAEIRLTGFYDAGRATNHWLTKGGLAKEMGCDYLIDDQPKHCFSAAEAGIRAVLFGDYGFSRQLELPPRVTRCKDWAAVRKYFDGQS